MSAGPTDEVLKGRTALVIAHRLSTIRNADKIIALEGGRIREVGDQELLSRGGLYSQLYRRQIELAAVGTAPSTPTFERVSFKNMGKAVWMSQ